MVTQKNKEVKEMIEFLIGIVVGVCGGIIHSAITESMDKEYNEQQKNNE